MKPSMLGLLIAAGAFGASTVYLTIQLDEERDRADEVLERSRALSARIAELESARAELESMRLADVEESVDSLPPANGKSRAAATHTAALEEVSRRPEAGASADPAKPFVRPERTEAMRKMMRSQMRANYKRLNADIGDKLGLGKDDANKLIDLMIEQQLAMGERGWLERGSSVPPEQRVAAMNAQREKNLNEIVALIGADKVEAYKAYQDTMPARQEVDMLSRQLEANDLTLSKDQRDRLVTALSEERKRVPQPRFSDSGSREEYLRAMADWQEDYSQRTATRASSILDSDQQATYGEYQQWNKEMRQQVESRRAAREDNRQ